MGAIYSLPMCARNGGDKEETQADGNNNEPMPTLQHNGLVVSIQPMAGPPQETHDLSPEATSTPRSRSRQVTPFSEHSISESLESEDLEGHAIDEEVLNSSQDRTSDSGLEQSSSDELELGPPSLRSMRPVSVIQRRTPPPLPQDEGINESSVDVTLPLGNHETCDEEDEDSDVEEPHERPPEPTVPDERVDSTSSEDRSSSSSPMRRVSRSPSNPPEVLDPRHLMKKDDTKSAISDLLSEIVNSDGTHQIHAEERSEGFGVMARNPEAVSR
ncbi:hypothetical protein TCAL_17181 [Tigriopus californicus]|uniref:Uncharacterized protein n=1 Tax=Tigriopus californicus TaxID=6832 RepID=A0A553N8C5_TIGCA|nr:uncharacterized protein LOC131885225 [Tigriopus californicus]XP_059089168.1 uncharacterized protein LOC131885225 [Tigriopus californicus]TRY61696.1 hypothetical protein TCAL_17181 [Tigriopus californicus]